VAFIIDAADCPADLLDDLFNVNCFLVGWMT